MKVNVNELQVNYYIVNGYVIFRFAHVLFNPNAKKTLNYFTEIL